MRIKVWPGVRPLRRAQLCPFESVWVHSRTLPEVRISTWTGPRLRLATSWPEAGTGRRGNGLRGRGSNQAVGGALGLIGESADQAVELEGAGDAAGEIVGPFGGGGKTDDGAERKRVRSHGVGCRAAGWPTCRHLDPGRFVGRSWHSPLCLSRTETLEQASGATGPRTKPCWTQDCSLRLLSVPPKRSSSLEAGRFMGNRGSSRAHHSR